MELTQSNLLYPIISSNNLKTLKLAARKCQLLRHCVVFSRKIGSIYSRLVHLSVSLFVGCLRAEPAATWDVETHFHCSLAMSKQHQPFLLRSRQVI